MSHLTLDQIIDALDRGRQRATYGAVAALLNEAPRTLMKGRERDQRHSWIVSAKNNEPTGYPPEQVHPDLHAREEVLATREDLERWLDSMLAAV